MYCSSEEQWSSSKRIVGIACPTGSYTPSHLRSQERATLRALEEDEGVQQCRSCGAAVSKVDGCDKFMCRCGYKFCWKCGAENAACRCTGREHGFADPRARERGGASPAKGKRRRSPWQR